MVGRPNIDIESELAELRARQTATETIQAQLLLNVAGLTDSPGGFVRRVMDHAERSLSASARAAEGEERKRLQDAIEVFNDRSGSLIAALTSRKNPQ